MKELLGVFLGYALLVAAYALLFWATISFSIWDWNVSLWPSALRTVMVASTAIAVVSHLIPWRVRQS